MCVECNVPLCITPCFRDYHTKKTILVCTCLYCVCTYKYMCIRNGYVQHTSMLCTCSYAPYAPYLYRVLCPLNFYDKL